MKNKKRYDTAHEMIQVIDRYISNAGQVHESAMKNYEKLENLGKNYFEDKASSSEKNRMGRLQDKSDQQRYFALTVMALEELKEDLSKKIEESNGDAAAIHKALSEADTKLKEIFYIDPGKKNQLRSLQEKFQDGKETEDDKRTIHQIQAFAYLKNGQDKASIEMQRMLTHRIPAFKVIGLKVNSMLNKKVFKQAVKNQLSAMKGAVRTSMSAGISLFSGKKSSAEANADNKSNKSQKSQKSQNSM